MLRCALFILFLVTFFTSVFAEDGIRETPFQITLGAKVNDVENVEDTLKGLEFQFGKMYNISNNVSAQIALDVSYTRLKYNYYLYDFKVGETTLSETTYGLLHTVYYNKSIGTFKLKPFFDIGFGNTYAIKKIEFVFGDKASDKRNLMYFKYGIGVQLLSKNGIGGQIRLGQQRNHDYYTNAGSIGFVYSL